MAKSAIEVELLLLLSDKQIGKGSGLLNLPTENVMADKGFEIQDLLDPLDVSLKMPPKRHSNRQVEEKTRRVAE